jgi:hypothetical protein
MEKSREMKPGIPAVGMDGIPIRDEVELEMYLKARHKEPCDSADSDSR